MLAVAAAGLALLLAPAAGGACKVGDAIPNGQKHALQRAARTHVESIRLMAGVSVKAEVVCGKDARVKLIPPAGKADPGYVILHKGKDEWKVVLGPGTSFSAEDRAKHKLPAGVWPPK